MRTSHILAASLSIIIGAGLFVFPSCSVDAKSAADAGYALLGKGDNKAALAEFEEALEASGDVRDSTWLRAAIGRCQALVHVDTVRGKDEFLALARSQPGRIVEGDFSLIANELLRVNTNDARMAAIDVMEAGKMMFPESPKLHAIGDAVFSSASRADDPEAVTRIKSLGYGGGK